MPQDHLNNEKDLLLKLGTIASFYGELDGRWVPFAKKKNVFTYIPDRSLKNGKHQLKVTVTDVAGNTVTKSFML